MNLSKPGPAYSQDDEARTRAALEAEDRKNLKRSDVLESFRMLDTATGTIKTVVMTSGAFVIT